MLTEKIHIASTRCDDYEEMYKEYAAFCEDNNLEPKCDDSSEFYEWVADEIHNEWDLNMEDIDYCFGKENCAYVLFGECGTWLGLREIIPEMFNDIKSAIEKCTRNMDDADVFLETDGTISIYGYHHDGTNRFTLRLVKPFCNEACKRAFVNYYKGDDYEVKIKNGWFQKMRPVW